MCAVRDGGVEKEELDMKERSKGDRLRELYQKAAATFFDPQRGRNRYHGDPTST